VGDGLEYKPLNALVLVSVVVVSYIDANFDSKYITIRLISRWTAIAQVPRSEKYSSVILVSLTVSIQRRFENCIICGIFNH